MPIFGGKKDKKGGMFGGYKTRQEQLDAQMDEMMGGKKKDPYAMKKAPVSKGK